MNNERNKNQNRDKSRGQNRYQNRGQDRDQNRNFNRDRNRDQGIDQGRDQQDWIETMQLEGRKTVLEALNHNKPIDRLLIKKEADGTLAGTLKVIAAKARELGVVVTPVERVKLDSLAQSGNHQGVIALCPAKEYVEVEDILAAAAEKGEQPFVIILDGISDPHNLGAILRTADAGGAHGVIIPKRRAVGLTGAVAKTSAGAIEHVPVSKVTNIGRTVEELKAAGLWVVCGDGEADGTSLYNADLSGPIALIIGAEGTGVSRLVREKADFTVRIPMLGRISSLNASVAAGIMIYEVVRSRVSRTNQVN